jgi:hypothetical protein
MVKLSPSTVPVNRVLLTPADLVMVTDAEYVLEGLQEVGTCQEVVMT